MEKEISTITAVVKWWDDDTVETVRLACRERGISVSSITYAGSLDEAFVVVQGPEDTVNEFVNDVEDGDADPYESVTRDMSDEEYQAWLVKELASFGIEYTPRVFEDDEN